MICVDRARLGSNEPKNTPNAAVERIKAMLKSQKSRILALTFTP